MHSTHSYCPRQLHDEYKYAKSFLRNIYGHIKCNVLCRKFDSTYFRFTDDNFEIVQYSSNWYIQLILLVVNNEETKDFLLPYNLKNHLIFLFEYLFIRSLVLPSRQHLHLRTPYNDKKILYKMLLLRNRK